MPHQDRRRAANQLEAINEFVDNKNSGLRHSVVLVDHVDAEDDEMGGEQIQPRDQSSEQQNDSNNHF